MYNNNDYILFVSQDANFQSRTMLIPIVEFLKVRSDDYKILKSSSIKNKNFTLNKKEYIVDNLLIINYVNIEGSENIFTQTDTNYNLVCNELRSYADGMDNECYYYMKDKPWYDLAITNLCGGFNHIYNYKKCKEITKHKNKEINIVDSFLVLESRYGEYCTNY